MVVPVEKAVLLILQTEDYEVYEDGIFLTKIGFNKVEKNILRLQEECNLLRVELAKFED